MLLSARNLLKEVQELHFSVPSQQEQRIAKEKLMRISDVLKPSVALIVSQEDHWNGGIYDDAEKKNLVTSLAH